MTFKEDFPSLKGKELYSLTFTSSKPDTTVKYVSEKYETQDGIHYPFISWDINKFCLDKQKVREVIDRYISFLEQEGMDTRPIDNMNILKKELGL